MDVLSEIESRIGFRRNAGHEDGRLQKQPDELQPGDRYFVNGAEQRVLAVFGGSEGKGRPRHPYWVLLQNGIFENEDDEMGVKDTGRRVTAAVRFYPWREKPEFVGLRNPQSLEKIETELVSLSVKLPVNIPLWEQMERLLKKLNEEELQSV